MAQTKTRWYSGKITTTTPIEQGRKDQVEKSILKKQQFIQPFYGPTTSEVPISRQEEVASAPRMQAGKNTGTEEQQICPDIGSIDLLKITTKYCCQSESNKVAYNKQDQETKSTTKKEDQIESNLIFQGLTNFDNQRLDKLRSSAATTAVDLGCWFPGYILQTLRQRMQASATQLFPEKTFDEHICVEENSNKHARAVALDCKNSNKNAVKTPQLAYKCPKKQPKFKVQCLVNTEDESGDKSDFKNAQSQFSLCAKVSPTSSSFKTMLEYSERPKNSQLSTKSEEKNFKRNTSPTSKSSKFLSDAELELNLASVSGSNVSSTVEKISDSTSAVLLALRALQNNAMSAFEQPVDHELYLAQVEQLKRHLDRSIKQSETQRKALDRESLSTIRSLSKKYAQKNLSNDEEKLTASTSHTSKLLISRSNENTKQSKPLYVNPTSASSKAPRKAGKDILKERFDLFLEESKMLDTTLNVEEAATQSREHMNRLGYFKSQSRDSLSLSSSDHSQSQERKLLKGRIKQFVVEARAARTTKETDTTGNTVSAVQPTHDKEQLKAIASLKERLRRSIKECQEHRHFYNESDGQSTRNSAPSFTGNSRSRVSVNLSRNSGKKTSNQPKTENSQPAKRYGKHLEKSVTVNNSKCNYLKRTQASGKPKKSTQTPQQSTRNSLQSKKAISKPKKTVNCAETSISHDHLDNSTESIKLKHSRATTSLHSADNKENLPPKKALGEEKQHKQGKPNVAAEFQLESEDDFQLVSTKVTTRSISMQTIPWEPEAENVIADHKPVVATATKGTQFSSETSASPALEHTHEMDVYKLLSPHTTRSQAISEILKLRYRTQMERARGEYAWLQLKKQRYKNKGLYEHVMQIRRKQQQVLKKMDSERNIIKRAFEVVFKKSAKPIPTHDQPKLSSSQSAPDLVTATNAPDWCLNQRLRRVESLLSWSLKLNAKEYNVIALEHMLMNFNCNVDISPETSTKNLLQRITEVEARLNKLADKMTTIEDSARRTSSQLSTRDPNDTQRPGSKLNQFWQRLKSTTSRKHGSTSKLQQQHTEPKCFQLYESELDSSTLSSSSQYAIFHGQHFTSNDDGIVVLYSPRITSVEMNKSSANTDQNEEVSSPLSQADCPTSAIPRSCIQTIDHQER